MLRVHNTSCYVYIIPHVTCIAYAFYSPVACEYMDAIPISIELNIGVGYNANIRVGLIIQPSYNTRPTPYKLSALGT